MRKETRKALGIGALVFLFVVCLVFTYDFLLLHSTPSSVDLPLAEAESSRFEGKVSLSSLVSRPSPPELQALLRLEIRGAAPADEIKSAVCSYWRDPKTEERSWQHFGEEVDGVVEYKDLNAAGKRVSLWEIQQEVAFPLAESDSAILYPFDHYNTAIGIRCCVNDEDQTEPCSGGMSVSFRSLHVDYGALPLNPGFFPKIQVSRGEASLTLERLLFLKFISVALLFLFLLFLGYLVFISAEADLLKGTIGYFGGLWALRGLIVHKDIAVFPTIVDYAVLTLFFSLFLGVFAKTMIGHGGERDHVSTKEPVDSPDPDPDSSASPDLRPIRFEPSASTAAAGSESIATSTGADSRGGDPEAASGV